MRSTKRATLSDNLRKWLLDWGKCFLSLSHGIQSFYQYQYKDCWSGSDKLIDGHGVFIPWRITFVLNWLLSGH